MFLLLSNEATVSMSAWTETFQDNYEETGQLIKAIDSTVSVIEYVYDDVEILLVFKYFAVNNGMNER